MRSDHEGRIEANAKLANDVGIIGLVLLLECQRTALCDGAEVVFQLFLGHTDAVILHGQDAVFLIAGNEDAEIALVHAHGGIGQALVVELIDSI